ncbi:MAG TPA: sigma-70 family RNA polymerase sigma factor [Acidobacteriota bacterium]|nr:sigma-70 family RNA polymerase sigma factor [Acidobacteriota bacterium]HNR38954.1 sigma-70 family RNA polymerase sigma factor [Acidobacteriota bacterium]HNU00880.1 sigma-70 family RNA polymerase sigma factor [Acidobacteriota bacterium]HPB27544.1 sigma-70 family RNA polymerase sigma factor [Acidobacteriota bacterium]HQO24614.1 sigma-70 family RNA polymerase sigma factor [Acidobacteriota bacterium]
MEHFPRPVPDRSEDLNLVARIVRGEEGAFRELLERYGRRIFNLARRMSGNPATAEDLTQEVFLLLLRKIRQYDGRAALSTWIYRVAVNRIISEFRRQPPATEAAEGDMAALRIASAAPALHRRLDLEAAIGRLPPGYRAVLLMHDVEGLRHQEIAEILDISVGTSKSQLHHARMQMRDLLQGETP